ncbi:MAG: glycerophosphodiester phosphodiesterase [Adhaeribacter sp.]
MLIPLAGGILFSGGCSLYLRYQVNALQPQQKKVLVIGHAGMGFLSPLRPFNPYPANSLTSLKKALQAGADGLEVDIHLSQDGVPILYHDPRLESMTPARGLIEEQPAASVVGLPYRGGFPYDWFQQEKVIAFESLLELLQGEAPKPSLHLDLRQEGRERPECYARTLLALLNRYHYPIAKITVISPQVSLLQAFRQQQPGITCLLDSQGDFETLLANTLQHRLAGVVLAAGDMDAARMRRLRQHGLQVVLFGPKAPLSVYRALLLAPDALQVNNVKALVGMVKGKED